jgi:hypothetical protein
VELGIRQQGWAQSLRPPQRNRRSRWTRPEQ